MQMTSKDTVNLFNYRTNWILICYFVTYLMLSFIDLRFLMTVKMKMVTV